MKKLFIKSACMLSALLCYTAIQSIKAQPVSPKELSALTTLKALNSSTVTLKDSVSFDIKDQKSNQTYRIFISIPDAPPPASGYPVVFVMDGNALFNTTRDALRAYEKRMDLTKKIHPVIVGIGYPPSDNVAQLRTYDLTPPQNTKIPMKYKTGGAEAFTSFIQDQLKPLITRYVPIDPQHQALMGHSFGGLFTVYNFVYHPNKYQVYVAASPSLWLDPTLISNRISYLEQQKAAFARDPKTILLTVGSYEQDIAPYWQNNPNLEKIKHHLAAKHQVDHIHQACKELKQFSDVVVDCVDFDGEDHSSVVPAAIGRGVAVIMRAFAQ